jgi:hypothetical protein
MKSEGKLFNPANEWKGKIYSNGWVKPGQGTAYFF